MKKKSGSANPLNNYARYSSIAIQMLVVIGGGVFGGYMLDKYLDWRFPVFTVILSFLSVLFAIYLAVRDFIHPGKTK
jgi:ATP synthase protein I